MQTTAVAARALADGFSTSRFGSASVSHAAWSQRRRGHDKIEVLAVRGLVTERAWSGIVGATAQMERRDESIAGVSLVECAVVALCAEQMCACEVEQLRAGLLRNPRAFVVSPSSLPLFRRYAWLMASHGVGRQAFSGAEMPQALRWAREMGQLMLADRQHRARRVALALIAAPAHSAAPASSRCGPCGR
jgi:hypothetical protein